MLKRLIVVDSEKQSRRIKRERTACLQKIEKKNIRLERKKARQLLREERKRVKKEQDEKTLLEKEKAKKKYAMKKRRKEKAKRRIEAAQVAEWINFDINDVDSGMLSVFLEMEEACMIPTPPKPPAVRKEKWVPFMQLPVVRDTDKFTGSLAPNVQEVRFREELEYGPLQWMGGCFELANEHSFGRSCVQIGDLLIHPEHATEMYTILVRNIVARATGAENLPANFQHAVFENPHLAFAADLASDPAVLRELDHLQYNKEIADKGKYAKRVIDLVCDRIKRDPRQLDTFFLSIDAGRARESTLRDRSYLEKTARAGLVETGNGYTFEAGRDGTPSQYGVTDEHAMAIFFFLYSAGTQGPNKDIALDLHGTMCYKVCKSPFAISNSTPFNPSVIRTPRNKSIEISGVSSEFGLPCVVNNIRPGVAAPFASTNAVSCFKDFPLQDFFPLKNYPTISKLNDVARLSIHKTLHKTFANIIKHLDPASTWFPASPLFRFISLSQKHGLALNTPTMAEALLVTHVINIAFVNLEPIVRDVITIIMEVAAEVTEGDVSAVFFKTMLGVYARYKKDALFSIFFEAFSNRYDQCRFLEAKFLEVKNNAALSNTRPTLEHLSEHFKEARFFDFCRIDSQKIHADASASMNNLSGSMLTFTFMIMYASSIQDQEMVFNGCQALYTHIFSVGKITKEIAEHYRPASPRLQRLPSLHRIAFLFSTAFWIAKHREKMGHVSLRSLPMPNSNSCYSPLAPCPVIPTTKAMSKILTLCKRYASVAEPLPIPDEMGGGTSYAKGFEAQKTIHCNQKVYVTERIPLHLYEVAKRAATLVRIVSDPILFPAAPVLCAKALIQRGTQIGILAGEERIVRVDTAPAKGHLYYHESVPYLWQTPIMDGYAYQLFAGRYGNYVRFAMNAPSEGKNLHFKPQSRGASADAVKQTFSHSMEPNCTFRPYIPKETWEWISKNDCSNMCHANLQEIPRFWMLETTTDIDIGEVLVSDASMWLNLSASSSSSLATSSSSSMGTPFRRKRSRSPSAKTIDCWFLKQQEKCTTNSLFLSNIEQ